MTTPQPMPQPSDGYQPPVFAEQSQAVTALVLSCLGIVACQVLCPVGWYLAQKELTAIDNGLRDPSKRDMAVAGRIVGIIGTVLIGVIFLAIIFFIGIATFAGVSSST